jgi:predicted dehydrogenase
VRIALAGLGTAAARGHLPVIARLASEGTLSFAGAAEPDPRRRTHANADLPTAPLFESAGEMLEHVGADVLVVAADPGAHAGLIVLGLERGLHVVCEKPLVLTSPDYHRIAVAHSRRPDLALISVHQYRYSPTWRAMFWWARLAARLHLPFSLEVEVQRREVDALAASPWRSQVESSGGMLADHGVHYLALAWTVVHDLDVLAGSRTATAEGERVGASVRIGSGVLTVQGCTGRPARRTRVILRAAGLDLCWRDMSFEIAAGKRTVFRRSVPTLADRRHVDSLYEHLYRDLVRNLPRPPWRAERTVEALTVGRALLSLLELSHGPGASVPEPRS